MARQNEHSLESISNANSFPKYSQSKYCGKLLIYANFATYFLVNYFYLDDCFAQVQYT